MESENIVREFLVDSHHGVYVPKVFATGFEGWHGVTEEDRAILVNGPDHEFYWDAWDSVLQSAYYIDRCGVRWTLDQDADLWAVSETEEEN